MATTAMPVTAPIQAPGGVSAAIGDAAIWSPRFSISRMWVTKSPFETQSDQIAASARSVAEEVERGQGRAVDADREEQPGVEQPGEDAVVELQVHEVRDDGEELDRHQDQQHGQEDRADVDVGDRDLEAGDEGEDEGDLHIGEVAHVPGVVRLVDRERARLEHRLEVVRGDHRHAGFRYTRVKMMIHTMSTKCQ